MDRRPVSQIQRVERGQVLALCDPGKPWSPRPAPEAVRDIVEHGVEYYVPWAEGDAAVRVVELEGGPGLWCDRDDGPRNNLLDLPVSRHASY